MKLSEGREKIKCRKRSEYEGRMQETPECWRVLGGRSATKERQRDRWSRGMSEVMKKSELYDR